MLTLYKKVGETPLECMEDYRKEHPELLGIPMTYAGRLDPVAEGILLVLVGEECKEKEKYLGLDKEYEVEVLFGIRTDTGDVLGVIEEVIDKPVNIDKLVLEKFRGKFKQEYPAYSSKTVNGEQLHSLARNGDLPDEMPTKDVEIYTIFKLSENIITGDVIAKTAIDKVKKVNGDFRQDKILKKWNWFSAKYSNSQFRVVEIKVFCSSGTYMRSLGERMALDIGSIGMAFSIKRIGISGIDFIR